MLIHAYGGLCNRLRVIISYRKAYGRIDVVWIPDGEICNAKFTDVFEPFEGVRFVEWTGRAFRTCDPCMDPGANDWPFGYRELRLRPEVQSRFLVARPNRPYSAMHVRRGDHIEYAKSHNAYVSNVDFGAWTRTAPPPIWLATDSGAAQQYFAHNRVTVLEIIPTYPNQDVGGHRNTTLAAAAIDLFICAGAAHFKGSGASSFTDTIEVLRAMGGWWNE